MDIYRILKNSIVIIAGETSQGKTMLMCNMIKEYKSKYNGSVYAFGLRDDLVKELNVNTFSSPIELETIKDSIIFIDEFGLLMNLEDRKQKKMIENTLRLIEHNNNKLVLCGLPMDCKKFICGKAKCFLLKGMNIPDLINGSQLKEVVKQYQGMEKGAYKLSIPVDEVLIFDGFFYKEKVNYIKEYDTKINNKDLFVEENVPNKKSMSVKNLFEEVRNNEVKTMEQTNNN